MAGSAVPAPTGIGANTPQSDAGTSPAAAMPPPGNVRTLQPPAAAAAPASAASAAAAAAPDPAIEALNLSPTAKAAAYALKKAHPTVRFTSGRRAKEDQARAMAGNVVGNRRWIEQTYRASDLRTALQDWVNNNPRVTARSEIADGLLGVFNAATEAQVAAFSKHLSGDAFDVQPVDTDAEAIKTTIRGLTGLDLFLDTEGGLVRWHAQF